MPVILALSGLWLMAGCFKMPVWEYRSFKDQHDFRSELGDRHSKRPVRAGAIDKAQVIERFGRPYESSKDGRTLMYVLETNRAVYVWPLCFRASPAEQRLYILTLNFEENGQLIEWNLTHSDRKVNWFMDTQHMRMPVRDAAP